MVWSDPEILELSRDFVTVADEVHFLYPEGREALARVAASQAHRFFKRFGEAMPYISAAGFLIMTLLLSLGHRVEETT